MKPIPLFRFDKLCAVIFAVSMWGTSPVIADSINWYGETSDGRQPLIAPYAGMLYATAVTGSTAATIEFGRGTDANDLVPLLSGLPHSNLGIEVLVGTYSTGEELSIYLKNLNGETAFSNDIGLDSRTNIAYRDTNNSLGFGDQSVFLQLAPDIWTVHLDDASSWKFDDDDNDLIMSFRLVPVPEPSCLVLALATGIVLSLIRSVPYLAAIRSLSVHRKARPVVALLLLASLLSTHAFAQSGGAYPQSDLAVSGSTLYGTTNTTLFKINTDGSGFSTMHEFTGGPDNGRFPRGVTLSGAWLYGTTQDVGGIDGAGRLYRISTDGAGFEILHSFDNPADGRNPTALTPSGSTFYGATSIGGVNGHGAVFEATSGGTTVTTLFSFDAQNKGAGPGASLALSDSTLYGTTQFDGTFGQGTLFKVGIDGSGHSLLHTFGGNSDSARGPVAVAGSTIYGASSGSAGGLGSIYTISTDGNDFDILHSFAGSDGASPVGGLILAGSTLYGATVSGGANGLGSIFRMNIDGTGFDLLHSFSGGPSDGRVPQAGLTLLGDTLFGTTFYGGPSDEGTIFSVNINGSGYTLLHTFAVPEPSSIVLAAIGIITLAAFRWRQSRY